MNKLAILLAATPDKIALPKGTSVKNLYIDAAIISQKEDDLITYLGEYLTGTSTDDADSLSGHASRKGHVEVVRLLLQDERVDPSAADNYAIRWASENGHTEVARLLLHDGRARL